MRAEYTTSAYVWIRRYCGTLPRAKSPAIRRADLQTLTLIIHQKAGHCLLNRHQSPGHSENIGPLGLHHGCLRAHHDRVLDISCGCRLTTMSSILGKSASLEHASTGLDRASFKVYDEADCDTIDAPESHRPSSSSSDSDGYFADANQEQADAPQASFANVRRVSAKVRSKFKDQTHKLLHTSNRQHTPHSSTAPALAPGPTHNGDDDRLFHSVPEHRGPQVKDLLDQPVKTISSLLHGASGAKAAEILDNQTIAHGANVRLVRAYDKAVDAGDVEEQQSALGELDDLKRARQDQYVRWTMDRHVLKVRRIPPLNMKRPQKTDFMRDQKNEGQVDWAVYSQHVCAFLTRKCSIFCS